ncbi:MAG TPA: alpha/beta fold hydrolase [Gemmataceae bacterium]|nr:alpha/beta fold hydrolase [Gemmataceae bacterium]
MTPANRTRSLPLVLAAAALLGSAAHAAEQEDLTVLKPDADSVPPRRMLYTYLQAEAQKHFDARRKAVAALTTPEDVVKRQTELKAKFLEALGGFPEKTPLNARVVGKEQRDGYRIEKVIYESRPDHHVTAVLYLPDGQPPFPGVLVPCGHSANGKAAEPYQRVCILMAKNGLAVLCYDPIGQGERIQLLTREGKPAIAGSTSEHTMVGVGALLVGRNTATYRIWDGIRSLDYLASRPEIDPKRLGCTGNSGGGTLTAYLMALDERIVAAAPSCYITSLERLFATIGPQDAEQNITGQVAFGMEHADYVTMRAPRPTLICIGTQDYFDYTGAWTTFREAKLLYGLLGYGERVDLFEYNDRHGFSKPRRQAAMRWMRRWLLGKDDAPSEGDFPIFKDEELQCTRTGQVLEDFKGKSVFDLNAEREKELARQRAALPRQRLPEAVRRLIALATPIPPAKALPLAGPALDRTNYTITRQLFETEPGIRVPGLLFQPKGQEKKQLPLVLYLHGDGKAADAGVGGPIERLVRAGQRVLALDLRGMGETAPGTPSAKGPGYFGLDSKEAFLALHLNRPLLGQRVYDALAVLRHLGQGSPLDEVHVIGVGSAGPIALHVAALEPQVDRVTVERAVVSWSAVVHTPISRNQLTNVVPGALAVYDLPDLAAAVAPRYVTIRAPVTPDGKPVAQAALEEAYAACRQAYAKWPDRLILQAEP